MNIEINKEDYKLIKTALDVYYDLIKSDGDDSRYMQPIILDLQDKLANQLSK